MPNRKKEKHQRITEKELGRLTKQIRRNCDVSDARNAGLYSICGLALRLRDLYKWEKGLPPWEEKDSAQILDWIGVREQRWEQLANEQFCPLTIRGQAFDPFDTAAINALLESAGLYYGAGYAHGLKPTFFLAHMDKKELVDGIAVISLGEELARDLLTIPALSQDERVLLRQDAARLHLWDKMFYINKSARPALQFALESCGLQGKNSHSLRQEFGLVCDVHRDNYIYHEIGEVRETVLDRDEWREMIALYKQSPVELLLRTVKDLLADTNEHGTLQHIAAEQNAAAFGFYVAFLDGLAKEVFTELTPSFHKFTASGDWQIVRNAVTSGHLKACRIAGQITRLHREGKKNNEPRSACCAIEQQVLGSIISK